MRRDAGCQNPSTRDKAVSELAEAVDCRGRRGDPLRAEDERLLTLCAPEHDGEVAAGPVQVRLDHLETKPAATAASNAFPPRSSTAIPAADASQCVEETIPKVPRSSGRVVKAVRARATLRCSPNWSRLTSS